MDMYKVGDRVRLTDHRKDSNFKEIYYDDFGEEWQIFWDEYVGKDFTIDKVYDHPLYEYYYYLKGLPSLYVNAKFYQEELLGDVPPKTFFPDELFDI